jgi:hypothetical protein
MATFVLGLMAEQGIAPVSLCFYVLFITVVTWIIGGLYYFHRWSSNKEQWSSYTYIKRNIGGFLYTIILWPTIVFWNGDPIKKHKSKRKIKEQ